MQQLLLRNILQRKQLYLRVESIKKKKNENLAFWFIFPIFV